MQFYTPNDQALDADRAKDAREAVEQDGPKAFYLKPGVTQVRVLPPFSERGVWYREIQEYSFVSDGQRRTVTAPAEGPDPVAEKRQQLLEAGGDANMKLAKDLKPRRKFLFNVLVWSAPPGVEFKQGQVYVLKAGVTVKRDLLDLDRDAQGGWANITDPQAGVNLRITRKGQGLNTEYSVAPMPQRTDLAQDLAAVGVNINDLQLYNLDSLYPPKDESNLRELAHGIRADVGSGGAAPGVLQHSKQLPHAATAVHSTGAVPVPPSVVPQAPPAPGAVGGHVPQPQTPAPQAAPAPSVQPSVAPTLPPAPPAAPAPPAPSAPTGGEHVVSSGANEHRQETVPPVPPAPPGVNKVHEV